MYNENNIFLLLGYFNIRSLLNAIMVSTWLHFSSKNPQNSRLGRIWERLGGLLGRLGRVLERLGLVLERLGGVLERLGCVLGRLGAENSVLRHPGS